MSYPMLKLTTWIKRFLNSWARPSLPFPSHWATFLIICFTTHIACLSKAKDVKSWVTVYTNLLVWLKGNRDTIFCRKWVALGCWARIRKDVWIDSVASLYSSSVENRVISVWREWVPCLFLAIPGISLCNLCTNLILWGREHTPINFWTM